MAFHRARAYILNRTLASAFTQGAIVCLVGGVLGLAAVIAAGTDTKWMPLIVAAVIGPFAAIVLGEVRRPLLALIVLNVPLKLDVHLNYHTDAAKLGALGGFNISLTTLALGILYALWAAEQLARASSAAHTGLRLTLPPLVYLSFVALSIVQARDATLASFELWLTLQMLLLYIYIMATVRSREDVVFIVVVMIVGLLLESLLMIGLFISGRDFNIAGIATSAYEGAGYAARRTGGTLGSPNTAAAYLSLVLSSTIGVLLTRLGSKHKTLAALALGLGVIALLFTFSRGGWLAFILSAVLLCVPAWRRGWLSLGAPLAILAVSAIVLFFFQDAILLRLFGDDSGSAQSRVPLMRIALRIISDSPLWGVGANNYAVVLPNYLTPDVSIVWVYTVHNQYLLTWAQLGLGGMLAHLLFLGDTIRRGWVVWRKHDRLLSPIALGLATGIVGHMSHMTADFFNERPTIQALWISAGLIAAMQRMTNAQDVATRKG